MDGSRKRSPLPIESLIDLSAGLATHVEASDAEENHQRTTISVLRFSIIMKKIATVRSDCCWMTL